MKNIGKNKGITLIALVITIIVLLILAGVTIATLTGDNGILTKANESKEKTEEANDEELRRLTMLEAATNLENTTYVDNSTGEEKTVTIPAETAVSQVEGENTLKDGLVIIDKNGNEWVWIEVPRNVDVYPNAGIQIISFTDSEYNAIEEDLHHYTNEYRHGTANIDEWSSEKAVGLTKNRYYELKKNMLKSIYLNEGFWIGRYEAGLVENRKENTDIMSISFLFQKDLYPLTYVTCSEAQNLANKVKVGNYTGSLMFGVQWDLVLKYLENKGVSQEELLYDSSNWGNYYNSTFKLNRGKYAKFEQTSNTWKLYTEDLEDIVLNQIKYGNSVYSNSIVLTTGASDKNKKLNIYDLAGNVWEWTLEYSLEDETPCVDRGGNFGNTGYDKSVSNRNVRTDIAYNYYLGFRVVLY